MRRVVALDMVGPVVMLKRHDGFLVALAAAASPSAVMSCASSRRAAGWPPATSNPLGEQFDHAKVVAKPLR